MKNSRRRRPLAQPPGGDLFDLVPVVKPLAGSGTAQVVGYVAIRREGEAEPEGHPEPPGPLAVEGRFRPPVNYVSDTEEP